MNWQPISTAPLDDTVIISDEGFVRRIDSYEASSWCRTAGSYCLCSYDGDLIRDSDEGLMGCTPDYWMPLPPLPTKG